MFLKKSPTQIYGITYFPIDAIFFYSLSYIHHYSTNSFYKFQNGITKQTLHFFLYFFYNVSCKNISIKITYFSLHIFLQSTFYTLLHQYIVTKKIPILIKKFFYCSIYQQLLFNVWENVAFLGSLW